MMGTLSAALEVREIRLAPEDIKATVEGDNELRDGLPQLTRIRIHYELRIPREKREAAARALARHQDRCPTAAWMKGKVEITWTADIEEI